jgi:hypothetical protein
MLASQQQLSDQFDPVVFLRQVSRHSSPNKP